MQKYFLVFALLAEIISGIGGRGRGRSSSGSSSSSSSKSTSYSSTPSYSSSNLYSSLSTSYYYNSYAGVYTNIALTPIGNYGYVGTNTYGTENSISSVVIIVPTIVILLTAFLTCYIISKKIESRLL